MMHALPLQSTDYWAQIRRAFRVLACLSAAAGLQASEGRWTLQAGWNLATPREYEVSRGTDWIRVEPARQGAAFLRGGRAWRLHESGWMELEMGLRMGSSGQIRAASSQGVARNLDATLRMPLQHSLGLAYSGRHFLEWAVGLDVRMESASMEASEGHSTHRQIRPWLRGALRHELRAGAAAPFLALEFAVPLTRPSVSGEAYVQDLDQLGGASQGASAQAHLPTFDLGIAFGYRF